MTDYINKSLDEMIEEKTKNEKKENTHPLIDLSSLIDDNDEEMIDKDENKIQKIQMKRNSSLYLNLNSLINNNNDEVIDDEINQSNTFKYNTYYYQRSIMSNFINRGRRTERKFQNKPYYQNGRYRRNFNSGSRYRGKQNRSRSRSRSNIRRQRSCSNERRNNNWNPNYGNFYRSNSMDSLNSFNSNSSGGRSSRNHATNQTFRQCPNCVRNSKPMINRKIKEEIEKIQLNGLKERINSPKKYSLNDKPKECIPYMFSTNMYINDRFKSYYIDSF